MKKKKTILAVAAHPDDIEFTSVITIKRLIEKGYECYYLIVTNGENGWKDTNLDRERRINIRKKEQFQAAKEIGVKKVLFWNYRDGFLIYDEELRKRLTLLIKQVKPEIIFSFDPANLTFENLNENHRDHREIAIAVFDACFAAKNDFIYPHKNGLHKVSKIFFYGSGKPDYFVDITKEMEYKFEIIHKHKSQFSDFKTFKKYFKKHFACLSKKYKYSEAFRVLNVETVS